MLFKSPMNRIVSERLHRGAQAVREEPEQPLSLEAQVARWQMRENAALDDGNNELADQCAMLGKRVQDKIDARRKKG